MRATRDVDVEFIGALADNRNLKPWHHTADMRFNLHDGLLGALVFLYLFSRTNDSEIKKQKTDSCHIVIDVLYSDTVHVSPACPLVLVNQTSRCRIRVKYTGLGKQQIYIQTNRWNSISNHREK